MEIAIALTLLTIAMVLFFVVKKGWIDDKTLQRLAHVAGVIAFIAALVVFIVSKRATKSVNENAGVTQYPDSQDINVTTGKEDHQNSNLKIQKEESLFNELSTKGSVDSAKSVTSRRLIINVSREVQDFYIYVDENLESRAHKCTLYVSEGNHTIKVNYEDNLKQQFEYITNEHVATDMTLSIRKNFFRPK